MRNKAIVAVISTLAAVTAAHGEGTVGDLSSIQSETILIRAKVSRAEAQAQLDARTKGKGGAENNGDMALPVVKFVYGVGKQLSATFLYSSGEAIDAKVGDTILGGYKVVSLTVDKVEVAKGKKRFLVGFSGAAPTISPQPTQPTNPMMGQPSFASPISSPGMSRQ
ncbi:type IV pilus biogenesis protein PilP [Chromobacterium haemolyticum]|uniref:type IV pilus biogenesis protein PilP n=1 Tax=Chromobacterium haemolyticum TaxID=394935 RepID=UPI00244A01DA|nr:type IV pilus biogenesis protein PilP [Chromobacterium haemolyticum]MDH0341964.1 type IV pilus biogenesis protein PilP [Chromobacterium haemolyticum]